jgi:hypothetical protein
MMKYNLQKIFRNFYKLEENLFQKMIILLKYFGRHFGRHSKIFWETFWETFRETFQPIPRNIQNK